MAVKIIPNQPVQSRFAQHFKMNEGELTQLALKTDIQKIQVLCSPHKTPINLMPFAWGTTIGASMSNNKLYFNGVGYAYRSLSMLPGRRYQLKFKVKVNAGSIGSGYRVSINAQWLNLPDASGGSYSIFEGDITTYISVGNVISVPLIIFESIGADSNIEISELSFGELSTVGCSFTDETGEVLIMSAGTSFTSYEANSNIANININWGAVFTQTGQPFTGKCRIHIYDNLYFNYNLITNGSFNTNLSGWYNDWGSTGIEWIWDNSGGPNAYYNGTGAAGSNSLVQFIDVPGGSLYDLQFTIASITSLPPESLMASVLVNDVPIMSNNYTSNGIKRFSFDLSSYDGIVTVKLIFTPGAANNTIRLRDVTVKRILDVVTLSNPFDVQFKHKSTVSLYGRCNGSAFGFSFSNKFYLQMRVSGNILYKEYPDKTEDYKFSDDTVSLLSVDADKLYQVTINGSPEYIHNAVRLIRLCDTFMINGKEYIKAGNYDVSPTLKLNSPSATFNVKAKYGIPDNTNESTAIYKQGYVASGYVDAGYY